MGVYRVRHHSGKVIGPLTAQQVRESLEKREIEGNELFQDIAEGEWKLIFKFPELEKLPLDLLKEGQELESDSSPAEEVSRDAATKKIPTPRNDPTKIISFTQKLERQWDEVKTLILQKPISKVEKTDVLSSAQKQLASERTGYIEYGANEDEGFFPRLKRILITSISAFLIAYLAWDYLESEQKSEARLAVQAALEPYKLVPKIPVAVLQGLNPAKAEVLFQKGLVLFQKDHVLGYAGAAEMFFKAATLDPENVKCLSLLATSYISLVDASSKDDEYFSKVSKIIEMSKAKGIELTETVIAEVEFLLMTNQNNSAIERLQEFTQGKDKFDPILFYYLAKALQQKGDIQGAKDFLTQLSEADYFSPAVYYLKGQILSTQSDEPGALEAYVKAVKQSPDHVKSHLEIGKLLFNSGEIDQSQKHIEFVTRNTKLSEPKALASAYFYLGRIAQVRQQFEAAQFSFERSLALEPDVPAVLMEYYTVRSKLGIGSKFAQQEVRMFYLLSEAEKKILNGDAHGAMIDYLSARDAHPSSPIPYVKLGDLFSKQTQLQSAKLNYKKATTLAPDSIQIWSKYIESLIMGYEWKEALEAMERFRKLPVKQTYLDKLAGDIYMLQKRYTEASVFYRRAMVRETVDPSVYIAFGKLLNETKRYADAPFFFSLAQRYKPESLEALRGIVYSVAEGQSIDQAIAILRDALKFPKFSKPDLLASIAKLQIQKGDFASARKSVEEAKSIDPLAADPYEAEALIELDQENTDKKAIDRALASYKSYLDRNINNPEIYLARHRLYLKKAQFEQANAELNRLFEISPTYPNLHFYKGSVYSMMGNPKLALEEYLSELRTNPVAILAQIGAGKSYFDLGKPERALENLSQAMTLAPENAEAKVYAARANQKLRNYPGAIALFQTAIDIDPGNPNYYKYMGDCFREMGDVAQMRRAFKKYLEMEPDAPDRGELERFL